MHQPHILTMAVEPKTKSDEEKMDIALAKLAQDDPTFKVHTDPDSGQTIISGLGELHLEIIVEGMTRQFKVEAHVGKPQVIYRETVRKQAEAESRYIRQTGGLGNYGHVKIRVEPNEAGKGFEFINNVKGGVVSKEYIKPVEQGIRQVLGGGVLAGYEIVDLKATLYDGSYHEVDSNEMAFEIAGSMAFKEAARKAAPVLLEPVMSVEVVVPEEYTEIIIAGLNSRSGCIVGMEHRAGSQVIKATAPMEGLIGYAKAIRDATAGRGKISMEFKRYEQRPSRGDMDEDGPYALVQNPKGPRPRKSHSDT